MRRLILPLALLALASAGFVAPEARADGDPGSDVLVNQPLFLNGDAGISVRDQVRLGGLLQAAARSGFPVRVAIISSPQDLGAITGLWRKPRAYARFLGVELSLAYTGRLVVVMPNGLGFNWPGHSATAEYRTLSRITIESGGAGLAAAAQEAVRSLAAAAGVRLAAPAQSLGQASARTETTAPQPARPAPGSSLDALVALIAVVALAATGLALLFRRRLAQGARALRVRLHGVRPALAVAGALAALAGAVGAAVFAAGTPSPAQSDSLATNPNLDPGTPLARVAPNFTLTDELARPVSLASFRGKVVLLAFNDSECTTICPLTTQAMLDAKAMLGSAGSRVQLLGVDANPKATSIEDVLAYSQLHGMLSAWHFLTGSLPALRRVWSAYAVQAAIQAGQIAHTPALFVIDPSGRERKLYVTQQAFAAVGQLGQLLAQEASHLLPGHPAVDSHRSYAQISGIGPAQTATLPDAAGGKLRLGPGRPRVYAFFATWDRQITGLAGGLERLGGYSALARRLGLPAVQAIDEGSVEPRGALRQFLSALGRPLPYPVAIDPDGRFADGYEVQGLPWLMVVSGSGRIVWYYSVAALGWPTPAELITRVRQALARSPAAPSTAAVAAQLAGSPTALAKLHQQANQVLGDQAALAARIRGLRGYPVVLNVWGSWCAPCVAEFGLFGTASAYYGRRVAFLGADIADSVPDGESFMQQHPVSYPSYRTSAAQLTGIVPQGLLGTPETVFFNRRGKIVYVRSGQYAAQGTLDGDIETYALKG